MLIQPRAVLKLLLIFLITIFSIAFIVTLFPAKTISFALKFFPKYVLNYTSWNGTLFRENKIRDLSFFDKDGNFGIKSENVELYLKMRELIKEKKFILNCEMSEVFFTIKQDEKTFDNIHAVLFDPNRRYKNVKFTLSLDKENLNILDFNAESRNVKINGNYAFFKPKNKVTLEFKVSFSPEISAQFGDVIKQGALSQDDNGWYSTVISFKGNALLLKALWVSVSL